MRCGCERFFFGLRVVGEGVGTGTTAEVRTGEVEVAFFSACELLQIFEEELRCRSPGGKSRRFEAGLVLTEPLGRFSNTVLTIFDVLFQGH